MKPVQIFLLSQTFVLGLFFIAITGMAQAADPECTGASQAPTLDFTDGNGAMCTPTALANGTPIEDTRQITCTVTFFDADGTNIGSESATGGPGTHHVFPVPQDGTGTVSGQCELEGQTGQENTVAAVYPVGSPPAPPVILP